MARNPTMKTALATAYAIEAPFSCLFNADPGTADAALTELSGGTPAYARINLAWAAGAAGVRSGTATHNVASGSTVAYAGVANTGLLAAATVRDSGVVPSQTYASQGTYAVTTTATLT